ncbi:MAG: cysteine hydrolase family protein [Anaerolineaceae bacterium]
MKSMNQSESNAYLAYLDSWMSQLPKLRVSDLANSPAQIALISVDMIKGFCNTGPLASSRINSIIQPVVDLMEMLWKNGVDKFLLSQDTHDPQAVEFGAWPPHCIRGTEESETISAIQKLSFYSEMIIFEKNSIATGQNQELVKWIREHDEVKTFIVVGDCTDLCTYQLAMFLRLDANEYQIARRVIVPANCVDTYDFSVKDAINVDAVPHPADFLHAVFLNHMTLNGIEVVDQIIN